MVPRNSSNASPKGVYTKRAAFVLLPEPVTNTRSRLRLLPVRNSHRVPISPASPSRTRCLTNASPKATTPFCCGSDDPTSKRFAHSRTPASAKIPAPSVPTTAESRRPPPPNRRSVRKPLHFFPVEQTPFRPQLFKPPVDGGNRSLRRGRTFFFCRHLYACRCLRSPIT